METKNINFYGFLDQDFIHDVNSSETALNMIQYMNEAFVNYYRTDEFSALSKQYKNDFTFMHNDVNHLLLNVFRGIESETFEVELYSKIAEDCSTWPDYNRTCLLLERVIMTYLIEEQDNGVLPDMKVVFAAKRLISSILWSYLNEMIREDIAKLRQSSGEAVGVL